MGVFVVGWIEIVEYFGIWVVDFVYWYFCGYVGVVLLVFVYFVKEDLVVVVQVVFFWFVFDFGVNVDFGEYVFLDLDGFIVLWDVEVGVICKDGNINFGIIEVQNIGLLIEYQFDLVLFVVGWIGIELLVFNYFEECQVGWIIDFFDVVCVQVMLDVDEVFVGWMFEVEQIWDYWLYVVVCEQCCVVIFWYQ